MMKWKQGASALVGIGLSFLFLILAFRHVRLQQVAGVFSSVRWWQWLVLAGVNLFEIFLRGLRWGILLGEEARPGTFFQLETIGLALNNVLPFRIGELIRAYLAAKILDRSAWLCLATVAVERVLDALTILSLFGAVSLSPAGADFFYSYRWVCWLLLGALAAVSAAFALMGRKAEAGGLSGVGWLRARPGLRNKLEQLLGGARALRSVRNLAAVLVLGIGVWSTDGLFYFWAGWATGLRKVLSYPRAVVVLVAVASFGVLPGAPGYFGGFEFVISRTLSEWGVGSSVGLGYAGFVHLTTYVVVTVSGLFFLYRTGYSLAKVWRMVRREKAA